MFSGKTAYIVLSLVFYSRITVFGQWSAAGITWTDQNSETSTNLNGVVFVSDALRGISVGDSGTILWTANGGEPGNTNTDTQLSTDS